MSEDHQDQVPLDTTLLLFFRRLVCGKLYRVNLEMRGYHVLQARSVEQCLTLAQKQDFPLLLVCQDTAFKRDREDIEALRHSDEFRGVPLILLGGDGDALRWLAEDLIDEYLQHPTPIDVLLQVMGSYLRKVD